MSARSTEHGKQVRWCNRVTTFLNSLRIFVLFLLFLPLLFAGCAVHPNLLDTAGRDNYRILPDKYKQKALAYETRGFWREAMQSWWIVHYFHPDDEKITSRINTLQKKIEVKAQEHFNQGVRFYQRGQIQKARREFLLTLAYDQGNEQALDYVEKKLQPPVFRTYVVQDGDTVKKVAQKEFHDSNTAFLLKAFNEINVTGNLTSGTILQVPILNIDSSENKEIVAPLPEYHATPADSPGQKTGAIAGTSSKDHSRETGQATVRKESDMQIYRKAKAYLEQEKYKKALEALRSLDNNFLDVGGLKASTEVFLQQEADAHYRKGISYFLSEELAKAIAEWEEVLRLVPDHLKARKDLQNARRMQKKVEKY